MQNLISLSTNQTQIFEWGYKNLDVNIEMSPDTAVQVASDEPDKVNGVASVANRIRLSPSSGMPVTSCRYQPVLRHFLTLGEVD